MQADTNRNESPVNISGALVDARQLGAWVQPRLVPLGTVAQMTAKIDSLGRKDSGVAQTKRT